MIFLQVLGKDLGCLFCEKYFFWKISYFPLFGCIKENIFL
jgi:hypothetical protein